MPSGLNMTPTQIITNGSSHRNWTQTRNRVQHLETIGHYLRTILPPCLVVVGVVLCVIVMLALRAKPFLKSSVFVMLRAYLWSCILVLVFDTALQWLLITIGVSYIADWGDEICRLWSFFINVVSHIPGWLVVVMVIDRYVHVMHSSFALGTCSTFTGTITVIFVCIGLGAISIHAMWTFEVSDEQTQCAVSSTGAGRMNPFTWSVMTDSFFYFIPQILIFVFLSLILVGCCMVGCYRSVTMRDGSLSNRESTLIVIVLATTYFAFMLPCCIMKIEVIKLISGTYIPGTLFFFTEMLSQMAIITSRVASPAVIMCSSNTCRREIARLFKSLFGLIKRDEEHASQCFSRRSKGYELAIKVDENPAVITTL